MAGAQLLLSELGQGRCSSARLGGSGAHSSLGVQPQRHSGSSAGELTLSLRAECCGFTGTSLERLKYCHFLSHDHAEYLQIRKGACKNIVASSKQMGRSKILFG